MSDVLTQRTGPCDRQQGDGPCTSKPKRVARDPRAVKADAEARAEAAAEAAEPFDGTHESRSLCEAIAEATGGVCFLGFSRGKDSIAAWLYLRRFFSRIIPFHCASVPGLAFVDESLRYYEQAFASPILRFMDGAVTGAIDNLVWQSPESEEEINALELWHFDKHDIIETLRETMDLPRAWCAFGINLSDSIDRRIYVSQNKGRNPERMTFYPCWDWSKSQIVQTIREAGIKLPSDYRMAARSMAAVPKYRHLLRMEAMYPEDFQRVENMLPMIRAELARQWFRERKAAGIPTAKGDPRTVGECTGETNQSPSTADPLCEHLDPGVSQGQTPTEGHLQCS